MKFNVDKLKQIAKPLPEKERQDMEHQIENQDWLLLSVKLAMRIRNLMDETGIKPKQLAQRMNVTPAQVSKILSGQENLGLKTIAKVEAALGKSLFTIEAENDIHEVSMLTKFKYEPIQVLVENNAVEQKISLSYTEFHKETQQIFS